MKAPNFDKIDWLHYIKMMEPRPTLKDACVPL